MDIDWTSSLSSDPDDSDIEDLLFEDDDVEHLVLLYLVQELEGDKKIKRQGLKVGRLRIPRNRALGHNLLMKDYFAEVPTYQLISSVGVIKYFLHSFI